MLSSVFSYISSRFYSVAYWFSSIGNWLDAQGWPWRYLSPPFYSLRDLCTTIGDFFYNAYTFTRTIEDILDDAWSKAKDGWNWVIDHGNDIVDFLYEAGGWLLRHIADVKDVVRNAITDMADWVEDHGGLIYNAIKYRLTDVADWVKGHALDIYNAIKGYLVDVAAAVTAKAQEIYAWVKSIPAEIKSFVDGIVATIKTWAAGAIDDARASILSIFAAPFNLINLWFDDIQGFFNSPLDWLGDKFSDWFFGPEK